MNPTDMKQVLQKLYREVWSQGRLELVDGLLHPAYTNHDPVVPGGLTKGAQGYKGIVSTFREAFPDLKMEIVEQVVEGDTLVSRWFAQGTHQGPLMGIPATGKTGRPIEGFTRSRFEGGKIIEERAVWDFAGLLRELGVLP